MRFVLIFCADNKRDVCLLFLFLLLVFGESALRPVRDNEDEEEDENEDEDENE